MRIPDQPPPTAGMGESIQALVREDLAITRIAGGTEVIADLDEREHVGISRYGDSLRAYNGRDPLIDAYQENLDLAVYLRQAIEEDSGLDEHLHEMYQTALSLCCRMRQRLTQTDR